MYREKFASDSGLPAVSALIAARDAAASIGACLAALAAQDYPAQLIQVIVADGCSVDATRAIAERFGASAPFPVKLAPNPSRSSAAGFNAALRAASGDVIVILGARARPQPGFLRASVAALRESGADAAGGVVRGSGEGFQGRVNALALGSRFGVGGARYRYGSAAAYVDTVNYGAYRREVFERIGGFDETMTNVEDDEFNYRLRASGGRLYLSPAIRCDYEVRTTLAGLARQFIRYGYPKARVLRRHPRQMRPRQFAPAAFALALFCGLIAAPRWRPGRQLVALLCAVYLSASLAASAAIARRHGWRHVALLPAAFATMHLGYGFASLVGTVRFLLLPAMLRRDDVAQIPRFRERAGLASRCDQV